jgi:hypothetical protein
MPRPLHQSYKDELENPRRGPKPNCECMVCTTCLSRQRQRRFYDRQRLKRLLESDEEVIENKERTDD